MASSPAGESQQEDDNEFNEDEEVSIHWVNVNPECSVCLQPCLHPVQLTCTHIFCFLCVKGFAFRSKKCALCRHPVSLDYFQQPVVVS